MEFRNDYFINEETVLMTGFYDRNGFLCTKVIEGEKLICVKMAPIQIINRTLLGLGSSLVGARDGSRDILGRIRMHPIHINSHMGIFIFPTKGYLQPTCVWFSLMHVKSTERLGPKKTKVYLSFNHTFTLSMKESCFNQKKQKAEELRETVIKNTTSPITFYLEPRPGIKIVEDELEKVYLFEWNRDDDGGEESPVIE